MNSQGFKTCATVKFSSPARVLPSSWCPDKDLVLVIMNVAGKDRLALWPREGGRKMWEVDINQETSEGAEITSIAWSPDGLHVAVSHHPPAVTIHSLQDGRQDRALTIPVSSSSGQKPRLSGLWWFSEFRPEKKPDMPDIFKRQGNITGSAHSVLKTQPLLDALHDDSQPLSASELFAFQGSHTRSASKSSIPYEISSWPTLPPDPLAASFQINGNAQQQRPGEELDEIDDSNVNSVLVASDDLGNVYAFLDGSYPLGIIELGSECAISSMHKSSNVKYLLHLQTGPSAVRRTVLRPVVLGIPFLNGRTLRDVSRVSTSAREVLWYTMRVVKEMRATWFGPGLGAREAGPKWLRALEERQRKKYRVDDPNAILDLTALLATGRASDSLEDFLGSGEQMSERSIQKWESNVTEALAKLRDYATKRVSPACQRLHVLLQEVEGWSQLPQYALCEFRTADVQTCLDLISRAIVCASWLAATARRELARFKEFIAWLRYESFRAANSNPETNIPPSRHDLLEVNEYLMSGLVVSSIDRWFLGPVPKFSPADLGVPMAQDLTSSVRIVREVLNKPEGLSWPPPSHHQDLSRLDRNLDSLMQDICTRCYSIFNEASKASARSAAISFGPDVSSVDSVGENHDAPLFVRERTVDDTDKSNCFTEHLAIGMPCGDENFLFLVKTHHDKDAPRPEQPVAVAVLQCRAALKTQEGMVPVDVLDAEFFDENIIVIIYRPRKREHGPTCIATVGYADLVYEDVMAVGSASTREALIEKTLERMKDGQISSVPMKLMQSRALVGCREGQVTLAVNGRVGRRVACVLDDAGLTLEILDVESPGDEGEEMEEA